MFIKLTVLILAVGGCGGGLLAHRQSRLQAAHELTEARLRLREHDERLQRLRARIAELTTPGHVRQMLAVRGDLKASLVPAIERSSMLPAPLLLRTEPVVVRAEVAPTSGEAGASGAVASGSQVESPSLLAGMGVAEAEIAAALEASGRAVVGPSGVIAAGPTDSGSAAWGGWVDVEAAAIAAATGPNAANAAPQASAPGVASGLPPGVEIGPGGVWIAVDENLEPLPQGDAMAARVDDEIAAAPAWRARDDERSAASHVALPAITARAADQAEDRSAPTGGVPASAAERAESEPPRPMPRRVAPPQDDGLDLIQQGPGGRTPPRERPSNTPRGSRRAPDRTP